LKHEHYDLHRHLEGSHSSAALADIGARFKIPAFFDAARNRYKTAAELAPKLVMSGPSDDASIFYQCIVEARAAYVSVEAIEALAERAFEEAAADCAGFEMRLSLFSMARTLIENRQQKWRDVPPVTFAEAYARPILRAVFAARARVHARTQRPMVLRLGLSRTFESGPHYRALAAMVREHRNDLVGLDVLGIVSGPDKEPLPAELVAILEDMRKDLPDLTIHAGEFEGHAAVDRTLELAPRGIGHGVHALQSAGTLERLAKEGVTLEVCPTSNRLLIPTALSMLEKQHRFADGAVMMPLAALQKHHVHCVLGSDDPTPMGTSFSNELAIAREAGVDLDRLAADTARRWAEITGG